jgi:hypothetical protein
MNARGRRAIGKSDPLDATAIGTAVIGLEESQLRAPRRDEGTRAGLRILSAARDQLTRERTVNVNALIAILRAHDLGIDARKPLVPAQITTITRWRERSIGERVRHAPLYAVVLPATSLCRYSSRSRKTHEAEGQSNSAIHRCPRQDPPDAPAPRRGPAGEQCPAPDRRLPAPLRPTNQGPYGTPLGGRTLEEDVLRCLKRFTAGEVFRDLTADLGLG